MLSDYENKSREIITKAVCGSGERTIEDTHSLNPQDNVSSILGCWVINHIFQAENKGENTVDIKGQYEINIWYAHNKNTKTDVLTEYITYTDSIQITHIDEGQINQDIDVIANVLEQPECTDCHIEKEDSNINIHVKRSFTVQLIGETKVRVLVDSGEKLEEIDRITQTEDRNITDISVGPIRKNG